MKHTHSNKSIIGTSRAENEMTSRAIKEVFELGQYSQQPANCFAAVEVWENAHNFPSHHMLDKITEF